MVEFKIKEHKYREEGTDRFYTSVTTVLKKYKAPFDSVGISEKYSIKHPEKTAEEWREEWKRVSTEACEYGTKAHLEEEMKLKDRKDCRTASVEVDTNTLRSVDSLTGLEDGVYPELLVWSNRYNIAGLIDKVEIKNGVVSIDDYKTFKKVDLKSFYNFKTKSYKMMEEPLHGLHDCNFNHAAIQIATYALILEELGYKVGKLTMTHITRDGDRIPYNIPYTKYKMFVSFMLLHFKKNG